MRRAPGIVIRGAHWRAALLASVAIVSWQGDARADVALYEALVPLKGTTAEDRAAGLAEALRTVAVRASGRREAADNPVIAAADPNKYVQRYSTTAERMLKVGFDGRSTEQLLRQAGLPLWPAERPLTTVDAPGIDQAAAEAAARWRGLPIAWGTGREVPSGAARAALTGVPGSGGYSWTFVHDGRTVTGQGGVAAGIDLAADALAARYAPASTRSASKVSVRVDGMDDVTAYASLLGYLRSLSLVREVEVESLQGSVVTLSLLVRGDRELLGRIAAFDGRLRPAVPAAPDAEGADSVAREADFVFEP
jgi:hypothetical protein